MDIAEVLDEITTGIEFDLGRAPDHPVDKIGEICDSASSGYRTLAGCGLIVDADTDAYYHFLARSGLVRRYFLDRCRREAPDLQNGYRAAGNSPALFDALAARHFGLAREVAALSNTSPWEGEEYAEDFFWAHFFHLTIRESPDAPAVQQTVQDLEEALAGDTPARLAVCKSLAARDQEAFDEAFGALLAERRAVLAEQGEPFTPYDEAEHRVAASCYIDGLAVLNVADHLGLSTRAEYRYCPRAARVPMRAAFPQSL